MTVPVFEGEYWNTDLSSSSITRLRFVNSEGLLCVTAWGSCFPEDCEWGETELHLLDDHNSTPAAIHAFATWNSDANPTHCWMKRTADLLEVVVIAIRAEYSSYQLKDTFKKDAARSADDAQIPDPIRKFKHMWDGSEPGWKLVQYNTEVFFVAFEFADSGPTRSEFEAVLEYAWRYPGESEEQLWERLRGCYGMGISPKGPQGMNRLLALQREHSLTLTINKIDLGDYLVLSPADSLYCWTYCEAYRPLVVKKMLDAGVSVVQKEIE